MPFYRNKYDREITIFLNNRISVKFHPNETRELSQPDLDKKYATYLELIPNEVIKKVQENLKTQGIVTEPIITTKKVLETNEKTIAEIKQPAANKELIAEPIQEEQRTVKKKLKRLDEVTNSKKLDEGYKQSKREVTIASSGK